MRTVAKIRGGRGEDDSNKNEYAHTDGKERQQL